LSSRLLLQILIRNLERGMRLTYLSSTLLHRQWYAAPSADSHPQSRKSDAPHPSEQHAFTQRMVRCPP